MKIAGKVFLTYTNYEVCLNSVILSTVGDLRSISQLWNTVGRNLAFKTIVTLNDFATFSIMSLYLECVEHNKHKLNIPSSYNINTF